DVDGAIGFLEKALSLDGTDPFIRLNLALACYEMNRSEEAADHLTKAVLLIQYLVSETRINNMFGSASEMDLKQAEEMETTGEYAIELLKEMAGITEPDAQPVEIRRPTFRLAS
ncbi:MAG: hypothetical protein WD205_05030, partial [Rhodothermales bacterium]